MKIGIIGWGLEGQSAYRYFGPDHEYLIVNEQPSDKFPTGDNVKIQFVDKEKGYALRGSVTDLSYLDGIENCDKIVFQPTAYFNLKKVFGNNQDFWAKATTAYDIFSEECPSKNIIGVTGTKGKGTTSTLIAKILQASGKTVHIGGNIGTPILDLLPNIKPGDWVVWELANFQLKPASHSPHIAVCLMITAEHLDWHPSMEDYVQAKSNLFKYQKPDDIAIYLAGNKYSEEAAGVSAGVKIPYFANPGAYVREDGMIVIGEEEAEIIKTHDLKLIGQHNWQNACAAITAIWQITNNVDAIRQVLTSFSGLEHRLELVRELNDVKYYDDSFGTNPDTAAVALAAIIQPVVLIAGGYDRGIPMEPLIAAILKDRVKHVIAIGQTGGKIAELLKDKGFKNVTTGPNNMADIVRAAKEIAEPGDAVLLSPAAASFDMFKNFEVRGSEFKKAVEAL